MSAIVDYTGDRVYQLTKNPNTGVLEDQTAQQLRRNYPTGFWCPCKAHLNEFCNGRFKTGLFEVQNNKYAYFISKHICSKQHQEYVADINTRRITLEEKTPEQLRERIEELEKEKRRDKVEFRKMLDDKEKEFKKELERYKEIIDNNKELIRALKAKAVVPVGNLIDL